MNTDYVDRAVRIDRAEEWLREHGYDDPLEPTPADAVRFRNTADMRAQLGVEGDLTFTRDVMRAWRSRIVGGLVGGRFVITSDDPFDDDERQYTVRYATRREGRTTTRQLHAETLSTHATIAQAQAYAREVAALLFGYGR